MQSKARSGLVVVDAKRSMRGVLIKRKRERREDDVELELYADHQEFPTMSSNSYVKKQKKELSRSSSSNHGAGVFIILV